MDACETCALHNVRMGLAWRVTEQKSPMSSSTRLWKIMGLCYLSIRHRGTQSTAKSVRRARWRARVGALLEASAVAKQLHQHHQPRAGVAVHVHQAIVVVVVVLGYHGKAAWSRRGATGACMHGESSAAGRSYMMCAFPTPLTSAPASTLASCTGCTSRLSSGSMSTT